MTIVSRLKKHFEKLEVSMNPIRISRLELNGRDSSRRHSGWFGEGQTS